MPRKKQTDHKEAIDAILIEELDIERDELLVPNARLVDFNADDDTLAYIAVRLEDELEIELPDDAESRFITINDVYKCVAQLRQ